MFFQANSATKINVDENYIKTKFVRVVEGEE